MIPGPLPLSLFHIASCHQNPFIVLSGLLDPFISPISPFITPLYSSRDRIDPSISLHIPYITSISLSIQRSPYISSGSQYIPLQPSISLYLLYPFLSLYPPIS